MTRIGDYNAAASSQLPVTLPPRVAAMDGRGDASTSLAAGRFSPDAKNNSADELRKQFTQFVGETFYGQMIKSMRSTLGKPAYFHGGRGEAVFQGQLDQQMAEELTESTAAKFSEPLFERQFPHLAERKQHNDLNQLALLPRR